MPAFFPPPHPTRADGIEARNRILLAALALFAEKGFAKTSTREIALAANANIAAISYYFGDKAGLYAATFTEPMGGDPRELTARFSAPGISLEEALHIFMEGYLAPLKNGEIARQCMRLHMREMVEPTSQWRIELERDIQAPHEALVGVLCRHLQVPKADDDMHRLAFSVAGMAIQMFLMQEVIDFMRPSLLQSTQQIDTWTDRLVSYALAVVASEAQRRSEEKKVAQPTKRASSNPKRAPSTRNKTEKKQVL
ncbi:CerR family C-terminal domain-containing protein [Variovorax sp. J22G21]|uniref:CerR family C-terminal domain-containing protein n=1 Tax=Variovorax fucosicus TaxID=3053517 RepID=UPI002578DEA7|nr:MULTISPECIES: CerR family C-terminal domain-containing protein [unclassified Variovorax]MDM0042083.1 CerR family C-terminal domain-containing protein [Variovorax sp. J22R193]MDM0059853.1 CerR family C-terminal domain-containing protein [Variovorax sp. J22G21]